MSFLSSQDVLVSVSGCSTSLERVLGSPDYCRLAGVIASQRRYAYPLQLDSAE